MFKLIISCHTGIKEANVNQGYHIQVFQQTSTHFRFITHSKITLSFPFIVFSTWGSWLQKLPPSINLCECLSLPSWKLQVFVGLSLYYFSTAFLDCLVIVSVFSTAFLDCLMIVSNQLSCKQFLSLLLSVILPIYANDFSLLTLMLPAFRVDFNSSWTWFWLNAPLFASLMSPTIFCFCYRKTDIHKLQSTLLHKTRYYHRLCVLQLL